MFCDPLQEYLGVLLQNVRPDPNFDNDNGRTCVHPSLAKVC
jgi:hypothetical protein